MAEADSTLAKVLARLDQDAVLAHILGNGLIGVLLVGLNGDIVFANLSCCRMVGGERGDLAGRTLDELIHPDDREGFRRDHQAVVAEDGISLRFRAPVLRQDGRTVWMKGSVSLLRSNRTSEPPLLVYLVTDVTALKEMALERERLHMTLNSIADAVFCTDTQSLVTFMNPLAERLTGCTAAEATGCPAGEIFNLIDERSGRPPASPIEQCMAERRALTIEAGTILLSRNGDAFDIGLSAAPVKTEE